MDEDWKRYLQMAASGGLTGAAFGGLGRMLGGSRSLPAILGASVLGGATGATTIPAAAYAGESVLGSVTPEEMQPYTKRAGLGGALAGAGLGAAGGAAVGSGLSKYVGDALPGLSKVASSQLPLDNILMDKLRKMGGKKGALIGALLGAGTLGYAAADEGQQLDTIRNLSSELSGGVQ